jgi:hypothetical protein
METGRTGPDAAGAADGVVAVCTPEEAAPRAPGPPGVEVCQRLSERTDALQQSFEQADVAVLTAGGGGAHLHAAGVDQVAHQHPHDPDR